LEAVNGIGSQGHDSKVGKESLEAFLVGFFHELDQDAIIEDAIAYFSLTVFDVGPVFIVRVDLGEAIRISLLVKHFRQFILFLDIHSARRFYVCHELALVEHGLRRFSVTMKILERK